MTRSSHTGKRAKTVADRPRSSKPRSSGRRPEASPEGRSEDWPEDGPEDWPEGELEDSDARPVGSAVDPGGSGGSGRADADARPEVRRDDEAVRRFVERLAMTLDEMGVPRMPGRVLAAMTAADEESLTAADLAERLDVSPAAISGAVRYLLHIGLIAREPVRGTRTHHYRLPSDVWYESSIKRRGMVKTVADLADEGVKALGGPDTPSGRRVAEMSAFYRFIESEMDSLFDKWQAIKAARHGGESS
jgi:hypothetical protein